MNTIIGVKKEMTQVFTEEGKIIPVTVVDVSNVEVVNVLKDGDRNTHIVIGKGSKKNPTKPEQNKYKKIGYVPFFICSEKLNVEEQDLGTEVGQKIELSSFQIGDKVKVTSTSKGKGFQGVVKRWGFRGGPKTHGQSNKWRSPGSIGSGTTPGRVVKGKKMGGHMGSETCTVTNLKIVKIDEENKLILISGSIPGAKGSYLKIQKQQY